MSKLTRAAALPQTLSCCQAWSTPMFAKTLLTLMSAIGRAPMIAGAIATLITAHDALARGGTPRIGTSAIAATTSGEVRDHRGDRGTPPVQLPPCHLYLGHWTGPGECKGTIVRDHRH
jgi:hypothetical protein